MSLLKSRGIAGLIVLVAMLVFGWTLVHATLYAPEAEVIDPAAAAQAPARKVSTSALPARLIIPALNINASVQQVGVKADGSMGTPNNFTDVAWYKYGVVPGQEGTAFIDGHVDNGLSLAGVFKHLADINVGDDVYVQKQNGTKLHFVVIDVKSYPYTGVPMQEMAGQIDAARLDLITCEGTWVSKDKTYDERLVVYTKLAGS